MISDRLADKTLKVILSDKENKNLPLHEHLLLLHQRQDPLRQNGKGRFGVLSDVLQILLLDQPKELEKVHLLFLEVTAQKLKVVGVDHEEIDGMRELFGRQQFIHLINYILIRHQQAGSLLYKLPRKVTAEQPR
jgi:hypothetical protein